MCLFSCGLISSFTFHIVNKSFWSTNCFIALSHWESEINSSVNFYHFLLLPMHLVRLLFVTMHRWTPAHDLSFFRLASHFFKYISIYRTFCQDEQSLISSFYLEHSQSFQLLSINVLNVCIILLSARYCTTCARSALTDQLPEIDSYIFTCELYTTYQL